MNAETSPKKVTQVRLKSVKYDEEVRAHVGKLWRTMNRPGGRKMRAAMVDWLPFYDCEQRSKRLLYEISAAQIDRILKPIRAEFRRKNNTGTRRSKSKVVTEVPIKPLGKVIIEPGHIEADTVAHCGESLAGRFVWTLNAIDLFSRWVCARALWHKESYMMKQELEYIESTLPFEWKSLFVDGGVEFINSVVVRDFAKDPRRKTPIKMERSRPYRKNDQAHIEQSNNPVVRGLFGYGRIDSQKVLELMNKNYEDWCLLQNFCVPQVRLIEKKRIGSKVYRKYSEPRTPYDVLLDCSKVDLAVKNRLIETKLTLNPFLLTERIRSRLKVINRWCDIDCNLRGRMAS